MDKSWFDKKSPKMIVTDLDIPSDADGSIILNNSKYLLKECKKVYPNIKKIVLTKDVAYVDLPNKMFPNVRYVLSASPYYISGPYLIDSNKVLFNTFCLQENEILDLNGVVSIKYEALEGVQTQRCVNTDALTYCTIDSFSGSIFETVEGPFNGRVLRDVGNKESYRLNKNTLLIADGIKFDNLKEIIIDNIHQLNLFWDIDYIFDTVTIDCRGNDTYLMDYIHTIKAKNINIINGKTYRSHNGIVYDTIKKSVAYCPQYHTGNVVIPEGTLRIDDKAFRLSSISAIKLPDSLSIIGNEAFFGSSVQNVIFGNNLSFILHSAFSHTEVSSLEFPKSLSVIEEFAFYSCIKLKKVIFQEGLKKIERSAFYDDEMESVTLPKTIKALGSNCFNKVHSLHWLTPMIPIREVLYAITDESKNDDLIYTQLYLNDNKYYIPKNVFGHDIGLMAESIKSGYTIMTFKYAKYIHHQYKIAIDVYKDTKSEQVKRYLNHNILQICKYLTNEQELIYLIGVIKPSQDRIMSLFDIIDSKNMVTVKAYMLNMLSAQKETKFIL